MYNKPNYNSMCWRWIRNSKIHSSNLFIFFIFIGPICQPGYGIWRTLLHSSKHYTLSSSYNTQYVRKAKLIPPGYPLAKNQQVSTAYKNIPTMSPPTIHIIFSLEWRKCCEQTKSRNRMEQNCQIMGCWRDLFAKIRIHVLSFLCILKWGFIQS